MAKWQVRIGRDTYKVDAKNRYDAKIKGARLHARKYPNSYFSASQIIGKFKIKATRL